MAGLDNSRWSSSAPAFELPQVIYFVRNTQLPHLGHQAFGKLLTFRHGGRAGREAPLRVVQEEAMPAQPPSTNRATHCEGQRDSSQS